MNELLKSLADGLKQSSLASKLTAGLVAMAVVLAVGVSAVVGSKPHYDMLLSGLDDSESAQAMVALAEAGIAFEASQPPGPFVIYVDQADRSAAFAAIYQSGAMIPLKKGIPSDQGGMSSVFLSNQERIQMSQKRLWGEMESVIEELDFVSDAHVQTTTSEPSPFSSERPRRTAAVTVTVRNMRPMTEGQANTIVLLVGHGLEIEPNDIILSDQSGNLLNGAEEEEEGDEAIRDTLEYKQRYDAALSKKANGALSDLLGPNKARVEVDSLWNFEQSTTSSEITSKGTVVTEKTNESTTPVAGSSPAVASGVLDTGDSSDGSSGDPPIVTPPVAELSETTKEHKPSREVKETVRIAPVLTRLSVALFLDDSISPDQVLSLEGAVKAAVGYDEEARADNFQTVSLPFVLDEPVVEEESPEGSPAEGAEVVEESEPSPMMQMLLRRGVEIAVAMVFIVLLLKSLRSAKGAETTAAAAAAAANSEDEVDLELLAQAQVQELLSSDPERVGEILSQWARDEESVGAGK